MSFPGFTIWFTGLPCSGKSTISVILAETISPTSACWGSVHSVPAAAVSRSIWSRTASARSGCPWPSGRQPMPHIASR